MANFAKIFRQFFRWAEVVDVDERIRRRDSRVLAFTGAHHNRHNTMVESIDEELFCDVIFAVGILKR